VSSSKTEDLATASKDISFIGADKFARATKDVDSSGAVRAKKAINDIKAPGSLSTTFSVKAKGNIGGFAHAKGSVALAKGQKTLMGELGPELVVSNGRYFVVGENGAEFVDLDKDAIVFNHL